MNPPAQGPVPSPCISLCRISARHGICEGCFRTLDEIAKWSTLSDDGKREIWAELDWRRDQVRQMDLAARQASASPSTSPSAESATDTEGNP